MASYKIHFQPSVEKDIRRISKSDLRRIFERIEKLSSDPFSRGVVKLTGLNVSIASARETIGLSMKLKLHRAKSLFNTFGIGEMSIGNCSYKAIAPLEMNVGREAAGTFT